MQRSSSAAAPHPPPESAQCRVGRMLGPAWRAPPPPQPASHLCLSLCLAPCFSLSLSRAVCLFRFLRIPSRFLFLPIFLFFLPIFPACCCYSLLSVCLCVPWGLLSLDTPALVVAVYLLLLLHSSPSPPSHPTPSLVPRSTSALVCPALPLPLSAPLPVLCQLAGLCPPSLVSPFFFFIFFYYSLSLSVSLLHYDIFEGVPLTPLGCLLAHLALTFIPIRCNALLAIKALKPTGLPWLVAAWLLCSRLRGYLCCRR